MRLEFTFKAPLDKIYPFIADFEKFGSLHAYIERTQKIPEGFLVYETVPVLGFLKVNEQYKVQIDELAPMKTVRYRSQVKKDVTLEILFELNEHGNETTVVETIVIKSNPAVRWMMENMMRRAHQQLFANLATKPLQCSAP